MSSHLIRSDLIPVGVGYLILMVVLAAGMWAAGRRLRAGQSLNRNTGRCDRGWKALLWHVATDALGGYLLLVGVVVLYYYYVARVGGHFLDSAFSGGALLMGIALPVMLAASWLRERHIARRADRSRPARHRGNGQPGA